MIDKVILFGGSFDPVHIGHIEILRFVHNQINADKSILIPAKRSPLKAHSPEAEDWQRFEMLKLAIKGSNDFEVSDIEFSLPEPSYSYHTISHFRKLYGENTKLYWLAGADVLTELGRWYRIDDILQMCEIIIACRGGCQTPDLTALEQRFQPEIFEKIKKNMLKTPEIDVSSTKIRENLKKAKPVNKMLNSRVENYIRENKIY